ncbi:tetratricopeptide repeat protein, partial [Methyloceanibacter sp.]|uniref:tetratricopeptide repeat protein n=1 Tax=Methyloceanibacter sp. TaxID=1965321 RepID=UPI0035620169
MAIAFAVAALIMGGSTHAYAATDAALEMRREALLHQMLARPNDLDLAFEYAKLSTEAGDYEGAISTLERMLIYAPNTPRLQFELGMLYYRLGAYDVARSYFEQVLVNASVPNHIAKQVR